ncbi:hypothetical protein HDU93_000400 [Gonapodya sp. JEL0774]|nr:hypothetical protein HDU93_000400 [Gonapodya sp. JEL0774]
MITLEEEGVVFRESLGREREEIAGEDGLDVRPAARDVAAAVREADEPDAAREVGADEVGFSRVEDVGRLTLADNGGLETGVEMEALEGRDDPGPMDDESLDVEAEVAERRAAEEARDTGVLVGAESRGPMEDERDRETDDVDAVSGREVDRGERMVVVDERTEADGVAGAGVRTGC